MNKINWTKKRLTDLGKFARGKSKHRPRNDKTLFKNGHYPLVQTGDIKKVNLYIQKSEEFYNEKGLKQSKLWPTDTLCITIAANIAETALLGQPMCFPDSIVGFNAFPNESNNLFVHYVFELLKQQIQDNVNGSIQKNINLDFLENFELMVPPLNYQNKVSKLLKDIDFKITNNNAISKELESIAKTIYDYWFLQFEFPDKDGKPYKSNGGKMVWNDQLKQEIPEGWEVKYLSDIESNIVTGKTPSTKDKTNFGKDVPFICIGDIRNHSFINSTAISLSEKGANSQKKKFIPSGSLCVSCIATPGLIGFTTKDSQTNQQINTIVFNNIKNKYFLYFALFEYFNSNKNVKTGNTFSNMNKEEFSKIKIIYNKKLVDEYFNTVNSYFEKIKLCEFENEQLQSLRDFLLPMLMNGQVIIED